MEEMGETSAASEATEWTFRVQADTGPGQVMCLTGSCPELGSWKPEGLMRMIPEDELTPTRSYSGIWRITVNVPQKMFHYRYVACMYVRTAAGREEVVIRKWEADIRPRCFCRGASCLEDISAVDKFGRIRKGSASPQSSTECLKCADMAPLLQKGWILKETVVQIKLSGNHPGLQIWKKRHANKNFYIKVSTVFVETTGRGNNSMSSMDLEETISQDPTDRVETWPVVEVAKLTRDQCSLQPQDQFGILYEDEAVILFQAQVMDLTAVGFLMDIYARPKNSVMAESEPAEHIGCGHLMPQHLTSTEARVKKPIISKRFHPIGQFVVDCLLIHPLRGGVASTFEVSYAKHWKPHWKGLDVAHRGMGNSFTNLQSCSNIRENTIASIQDAARAGADMVEFDVQISKDHVPVIYHEFEVAATIVDKEGRHTLVELPVNAMTLEQLQNLKINHPWEKSSGVKAFSEDVDHQPFPTLEMALAKVDIDTGFNIEVKWDMEKLDGTRENRGVCELNLFVDSILNCVLAHAGSRRIIFSSFNPDVCTMLSYKQNRYPVLLLTQGTTTKYEPYLDKRTHTMENGSYFAITADILGISVIAEDIQKDPSQVKLVKDLGLILFTWTDDHSEAGFVKYLKDLGVDGVIYDRFDENKEHGKNESIFLMDRRESASQLSSLASCFCSPNGPPPPQNETATRDNDDKVEKSGRVNGATSNGETRNSSSRDTRPSASSDSLSFKGLFQ